MGKTKRDFKTRKFQLIAIVAILTIVIAYLSGTGKLGTMISANSSDPTVNDLFFSEQDKEDPLDTYTDLTVGEELILDVHSLNELDKTVQLELVEGLQLNKEKTVEANLDRSANEWLKEDKENILINLSDSQEKHLTKTRLIFDVMDEKEKKLVLKTLREETVYQSAPLLLNSEASEEKNTTTEEFEFQPIAPMSGNLNMDVDIAPVTTSVQSGTEAIYKLNLKTTGAMIPSYKNALLVVTLPSQANFTQNLSELIIAGVRPQYNATNRTLTYRFPELSTGQAYQVNIKVMPPNGTTLNDTKLTTTVRLSADNFSAVTVSAVVNVIASLPFSITKSYVGVEGKTTSEGPKPGDTIIWRIKATASSKASGLLFLKNNQKIVITDTLISDLAYSSTTSSVPPTRSGQTVTWSFDAPTLANQQQALTNSADLWSTEFLVRTRASTLINVTKTLTNDASVKVIDFGDKTTEMKSNQASIGIATGGTTLTPPEGTWYYPTYSGPLDGAGSAGPANPVPTVTDIATLGFAHTYIISPYQETVYGNKAKTIPYNWNNQEVYTKGYKYVSIIEKIDPNLIFESIAFSRPKNYARRDVPYSELNQIPRVTFKFEVNTVGNYKTTEVDSEKLATVPLMQLKRSDLKLVDSDRVLSYQVVYENRDGSAIQGGFASDTMGVMYRVKEGYVGRITNNLSYEGQVIGAATPFYRYPTNDDPATAIGPRSANVVKASTSIPVVSTAVTMVNKENVVETGDNKIFISLKNEVSSQIRVNKPINAAILLPEGVKLKSNPMPDYMDATGLRTSLRADARGGSYTNVTSNYNNTNRQLVRVKWNDPDLLPGQSVGAWLDVDVAATAPSPLLPIVYGFSGNSKFTVPTATGNSLTNSILEVDSDDLNGDANKTQNRVKSGNSYVMLREMNVQTEKLIKGERDSTYSRLGHTIPGGKIDYQLKISNTNNEPLTKFVLMDILPSVGDLGITDGAQRGSLFTPSMTGPITVPSDWVNKVTVSYSTAVNPKRDDLVKNVIYPGTTQKLTNPSSATTPTWLAASNVTNWATIHSFKIELNSGVSWVKGQGITLNFSMKAPDEVSIIDRSILDPAKEETSRAAWNSFAYGANTMQIVEPERVGVVMNGLGKVSIQKVDAANVATRLSGATFVIGATEDQLNSGNYIKIGSNGSLVYPGDLAYSTSLKNYEVTTNSQGIAQFEKLNLDGTNGKKYYLKEIKAPTGYQLPTKNIAVTASLDTSPATIQIGNIKKIAIPQTGSISLVLFLIIGTGLVGTGVMRYIKQQKNQKTIKQKRRGN